MKGDSKKKIIVFIDESITLLKQYFFVLEKKIIQSFIAVSVINSLFPISADEHRASTTKPGVPKARAVSVANDSLILRKEMLHLLNLLLGQLQSDLLLQASFDVLNLIRRYPHVYVNVFEFIDVFGLRLFDDRNEITV